MRRGAATDGDDVGEMDRGFRRRLRCQPGAQLARMGDGCRKPDRHQPGRQRAQPRDVERQEIAALRWRQRVQLVEDDRIEIAEEVAGIGAREQQRHLLRRRQQDLGRRQALALAFALRRVAGAGLDADGEAHLGDRRDEIARDVDGERLERRDVERAQSGAARRALTRAMRRDEARQETGERLAGTGRRDQQRRAPRGSLREQGQLMRARLPAFRREPAGERLRQGGLEGGLHLWLGSLQRSGGRATRTHGRELST